MASRTSMAFCLLLSTVLQTCWASEPCARVSGQGRAHQKARLQHLHTAPKRPARKLLQDLPDIFGSAFSFGSLQDLSNDILQNDGPGIGSSAIDHQLPTSHNDLLSKMLQQQQALNAQLAQPADVMPQIGLGITGGEPAATPDFTNAISNPPSASGLSEWNDVQSYFSNLASSLMNQEAAAAPSSGSDHAAPSAFSDDIFNIPDLSTLTVPSQQQANMVPASSSTQVAPVQETASQPVSNLQRVVMSMHNDLRQHHQAAVLTWNADLASQAQAYGDRCVWGHSHASGQGENLSIGFPNLEASIQAWIDEASLYKGNEATPSNFHDVGHYTQMVWKATTDVGCGWSDCGSQGWYLVCRYTPPGNVEGQFLQQVA